MTATDPDGRLPATTHVGRTALRVADLAETTDFYRRVVGLAVLSRDETGATLGVDGTPLLELLTDEDGLDRHRHATGLYHNAFRVPTRGALGDALARIREHWRLGGSADHLVSEALYLTDPEGNGVEVYRDFPREEWPTADDGTVRMATDPLDLDALAADAAGESAAPPGTDVGHVHLEVTSLDAFRSFYVDALGFAERATVPRASFVAAGGYHHHVGANTWHHRTGSAGDDARGLAWFEVVVPDATALEAVRERLLARDVSATDTDDGFSASDPDGITVRFRAEA